MSQFVAQTTLSLLIPSFHPRAAEAFSDFIPEDCPQRNCLWDSSHPPPPTGAAFVCLLCSPMSVRVAPVWCYSAKKDLVFFFSSPASLAPLMCHGQVWLFFALIFPHSLPLSLRGFSSLLGGAEAEPQTNFSHSRNEAWRAQFVSLRGNRIHSSVPQKTPFFQTERELFVWWQLLLSSGSSCDLFKSKSDAAFRGHDGVLCTLQVSRVIVWGDVCI